MKDKKSRLEKKQKKHKEKYIKEYSPTGESRKFLRHVEKYVTTSKKLEELEE